MGKVTVGQENGTDIQLYFEDHGSGQPVVLIHGFPLDGQAWDSQHLALLEAGYRVVTYDRRGFGRSDHPSEGFDYDTLSDDLAALLDHLDLREAVLVGFSMGGGEVVRYLSRHGSERVAKAVLIGSVTPYLLQADDNPEGVPGDVFEGIKDAIRADRYGFFEQFFANFLNTDQLLGNRVSEGAVLGHKVKAFRASALATLAVVDIWGTDFRADLPKVEVPLFLIHGAEDRIVPIAASSARIPGLVEGANLVVIDGGPHNICATHADEVNDALLGFLRG
ncbi:alpha/beta fold hydrolase [Sinomonas mesophila]|uniref:alpha/beta fold hydrolase n=1 Tax=Sinomonas mesophila TaxID=1531955 RepID=UPI0009850E02|nr:alpha/beta hydrolase [Sinomonas mesophila]